MVMLVSCHLSTFALCLDLRAESKYARNSDRVTLPSCEESSDWNTDSNSARE